MPIGDDAEGAAGDVGRDRLAEEWRRRFLPLRPAELVAEFEAPDPWAFAEWPDLAPTLDRLRTCAAAGAIGAAFDALYVTEAHRHRFWQEARKPMRPAPAALLDIAQALPEGPAWALDCIGRAISEARSLKAHRMNVIHRLRAWAVAALREVKQVYKEEQSGEPGRPPLWRQLMEEGMSEADARAAAEREGRRFTPALLDQRVYDRAKGLLADTPLVPAPRQAELDGDTSPDGDVLRASERLVREAFREGRPGRFYLPSDRALCALGMNDLAGWPVEIDRRIGRLFAEP